MYEIIVVGGGHAGCEAAHACAKKGHKTLLITSNLKNIADMPCNPHIGGSSKGHLVREIDALGGEMGKNIDKTFTQLRMLNTSKGPAVYSLRAQADRKQYHIEMKRTLENQENLYIKQAEITEIKVEAKHSITVLRIAVRSTDEVKTDFTSAASGVKNAHTRGKITQTAKKITAANQTPRKDLLLSLNKRFN